MNKFERLININTYKWLAKCARPHRGALALIIIMNALQSVCSVATAVASRQMIDLAVKQNLRQAAGYAGAFAILLLMQIGLGGMITMISARVSEIMGYRIQQNFLRRMFKIKWMVLNKYHSGDAMTRLTSDVGNVVGCWVSLLPNMLALGVQLVVAFFTLLYFDQLLAVFAFILGPISVILSWFFGRKLKKMQHYIQQAESLCRSYLHEVVQHLLIVKTFEYDNESIKRISEYQQKKLKWVVKRSNMAVATNMVLSGGYWLGYLLAFGWGAFRISTGSTSFGTFTAFLQLVGQVQGPFDGLSRSLPQVISALASAERLIEFEELETESEKTVSVLWGEGPAGLSFEHVYFEYDTGKSILSDMSLDIKPGEIIALVGTSGEGKTTIIRMLLSLIKPVSGKINLIGKNNKRWPVSSDTRGCFSYVPQGNTLFSGTIAENLLIGNADASEEELEAAAKVACAWDFIKSLPERMNTVIGENGLGLSEGQAQRMAIARAVLKKSPVLLLDEATSALDLETEQAVLENIANLRPIRTCIAITHRLSVLGSCDHIYRLADGRLYEQNIDIWGVRSYADAQ